MIFNWLDAKKAVEMGIALADRVAPRSGSDPNKGGETLEQILSRDDVGLRPDLNFYKRAKLANSFKWRLIENGVERATADEITQSLVLNLSMKMSDRSATDSANGTRNNRPPAGAKQLLAQGNSCMDRGAYSEAVEIFQRVLAIDPHNAIAHNNLGAALSRLNQYREAEKHFRAAIEERPDFADALGNLGIVCRLRGRLDESEKWLRSALKLNPKHVDARINLGTTLALLNRLREGKNHLNKVLKAQPRNADALFGMGQILSVEGRFDDAEKKLKSALQVRPKMPSAWAALGALRKMTPSDEGWLHSVEEIAKSRIPPMDASILHFAMGKYHDDIGQFAQAFMHYRDANELLKPIADKYDRAARATFVDEQIRVYSREKMATAHGGASASQKPVFVVGMMRSGTSLTEQIIASHPMAKGGGELEYWRTVVRDHEDPIKQELFLGDEPTKSSVAENYLRALDLVSDTALRVVDKAPINSEYLGVIHALLPNARIIYMQRDPLDVCLSCYFQNFSLSKSFALDLSDMAHYYQQHHRLMNHWRRVLPQGSILEVSYEGLVADQEGWTRKILDFVGLEWDSRCLDFQATERPIVTASFWQARQKMFKTSVHRWRNYEEFVEPLLALRKLNS